MSNSMKGAGVKMNGPAGIFWYPTMLFGPIGRVTTLYRNREVSG